MAGVTNSAKVSSVRIRQDLPDAKLICVGLTKKYGEFVALRPTDIQMPAGEFLTLLGPSGSGKTTLLMIIAGLTKCDSGEVLISGQAATNLPSFARDIGMVFQSYALFPHMTVFDNIAFPLRMRRWPSKKIAEAVDRALALVRLSHVGDRYPRELSGGQQQRIALARCVVYRPSIILMDEPLGALDKKLREHMQFEIKELQRDLNATVLYVTHDQDEAMAMSDRICLMNAGGIEQIGTPAQLYFNPTSKFSAEFLGESNLLNATVREAGPRPVVDVRGHVSSPKSTGCSAAANQKILLMVRPESVLMSPTPGSRSLSGRVSLSTMLGGIIRTVVRLETGETIIVKSLTHSSPQNLEVGTSVYLDWPDEAGMLLQADAQQQPNQ